jgi:CRISPR-associated protein Csm5
MRIKITTLTQVHISSGNEYELNFNLLIKNNKAYIYDEFKIAEFFIQKNITIPTKIEELKKLIKDKKDEIINANIHLRTVETNFSNFNKPLLENVSSQNNPIIPGSSIKGAIETAIFDLLVKNSDRVNNIKEKLNNQIFNKERFNKNGKAVHTIDPDFKKIFSYLKISDSFQKLDTKVYKTINIKKNEEHQKNRKDKVEKITNYVEAIKPNQNFEITLKDLNEEKIFKNIGNICNKYYIPKINQDIKYYFYKKGSLNVKALQNLNNCKFILNVGRFGGAEKKRIDNLRYIRNSHCNDESKTSAVTFALEKSCNDNIYFRNSLIPFGWLLCKIVDEKEIL